MTPEYLRSSYKQYKADSDAVATWLANTARRCGYPHDLLSQETSSQKKPKLKGRARKLARDAEKTAASEGHATSTATEDSHRYTLAIKEFMPLAQWILNSTNPVVDVPDGIVTTLNKTIEVRRAHNIWWCNKGDGSFDNEHLRKVNEKHGYFVNVLERVRSILRPRMPSKKVDGSPLQGAEDTVSDLTNRFSVLEVSRPTSPSRASRVQSSLKSPATKTFRFTVEQEPDLEEVHFAVDCFFHDVDNIRMYLNSIWVGYRHGLFDLVSVSLVTNTAMEFVRGIEDDFVQTFPQHSDFGKHEEFLYARACEYAGCSPTYQQYENDEMNFEVYDAVDKYLFTTYIQLFSIAKSIQPDTIPVFGSLHVAVYEANSDRASKSARDKFHEDKALLISVLTDLFLLKAMRNLLRVEDEMIQGLRIMSSTKLVPMWLTFATQIFLDINHILRDTVNRGFEDLQKSAKVVEHSIYRWAKFHKDLHIQTRSASSDRDLVELLGFIGLCVKTDCVQRARKVLVTEQNLPPLAPFFLLRHHPLLCGLLCFNIRARMQEASMAVLNSWNGILYAAHLYNAVRQEKMLSTSWKDMDLALMMHRVKDMFIGSLPVTMDDYFKRCMLAMGSSAVNFGSRQGFRRTLVSSKVGSRRLNILSPVSRMFKPRFEQDSGVTKLSTEDVRTILEKYTKEDDTGVVFVDELGRRVSRQVELTATDADADTNDGQNDATKKLHTRRKTMKVNSTIKDGVGPLELLNALLGVLRTETPQLAFDHLSLHVTCCHLLEAVQQEIKEDLQLYYGAAAAEKDKFTLVVGCIFATVLGNERAADGTSISKRFDGPMKRLLERAARVMEKTIKDIGETACTSLGASLGADILVPDVIKNKTPKPGR